MRFGVLNNIAGGLAGSFVSRNNDYRGYWALGQLRSLSEQLGVDEIRVQIRPLAQERMPLIAAVASRYARMLARLVERAGHPDAAVVEALIVVRLAPDAPADTTRPRTWGKAIACDVRLVDDCGKQASAGCITFCGPHDPSQEQRSSRYVGTHQGDAADDAARRG